MAKSCITVASLKHRDYLNIDILQGSVATRLGCVGVFKSLLKFPTESNSERILKIG